MFPVRSAGSNAYCNWRPSWFQMFILIAIGWSNGRYSILMNLKEKIGECEQSRVCESNEIWLRLRLALLYLLFVCLFLFFMFSISFGNGLGKTSRVGTMNFLIRLQSGTQISHGVSA